ncbi:MAG: TonB-dependent receptor domain-containing protein [Terriglobales bacterium]
MSQKRDRGPSLRPHAAVSAAVAFAIWGPRAFAQTAPEADTSAAPQNELEEIVVTGTTSKDRTVLTSSADIIAVSSDDLQEKAPRATDEVLELVPGMFVEDTAGAVSNNYSVRGLPGGGQEFVQMMEDGLLIAYPGTGNQDELFSYDINVKSVQAVLGGSSGVLTPNGAGATINWITRTPNFDAEEAIARVSATTYADRRVDVYYSQPIVSNLAFNIGGYVDDNRGTRDAGLTYGSYHLKAELEQKFDNGATLILSGKIGDQHDPYYADMPFRDINGSIHSVPGTAALSTNIGGPAFGNVGVPVSCADGCFRTFSLDDGIQALTHQIRLDGDLPLGGGWDLFAKARYLDFTWNFNGLFPGSGTGNAGLDTATDYLNSATSPIASLLTTGAALYPGATFGIKDLTTGQIIGANNTAGLNALNGNGLLEQTVLNKQSIWGHDIATNFGARWDAATDLISNSLTFGLMYNTDHRYNDQSAVTHVVNGVTSQSHIYDVVALNPAGAVIGSLTDHGLISYGDWGTGIWNNDFKSLSGYLNNELTIAHNLHVDLGLRIEHIDDTAYAGNSSATQLAGQFSGVTGLATDMFDGTYTIGSATHTKTAESLGVNYTFSNNLAVYGQYEFGFNMDTGGSNPSVEPTGVTLYEVGVRYASHGVLGSIGVFETDLNNNSGGCTDVNFPTYSCQLAYDVRSRGVEYDLHYRPIDQIDLSLQGVLQSPKLTSPLETLTNNGVFVEQISGTQFDGNTDDRTPRSLQTIEAAYVLPRGRAYLRYRYIGSTFQDIANQLQLPGYGLVGAGFLFNITPKLNLNVSGENLTNQIGLTEGNPRQGVFAQSIVNGTFYARGVASANALVSLTYTF